MKQRLFAARLWVAIVASIGGATAQEKPREARAAVAAKAVEFAGYSDIGQERRFVLYDAETRESSSWLAMGQTWRGCTVGAFDPKTEKLTLKQDQTDIVLSLRPAKIGPPVSLTGFVKGTGTEVNGTVVYSADAELEIGDDVTISSRTGLMVSDREQTIFSGDLTLKTERGIVEAEDAIFEVSEGRMTAKKKMSFSANRAAKPKAPSDR